MLRKNVHIHKGSPMTTADESPLQTGYVQLPLIYCKRETSAVQIPSFPFATTDSFARALVFMLLFRLTLTFLRPICQQKLQHPQM